MLMKTFSNIKLINNLFLMPFEKEGFPLTPHKTQNSLFYSLCTSFNCQIYVFSSVTFTVRPTHVAAGGARGPGREHPLPKCSPVACDSQLRAVSNTPMAHLPPGQFRDYPLVGVTCAKIANNK